MIETSTEYFFKYTDQSVKANVQAIFQSVFSAHAGKASSSGNVDAKFLEMSLETVEYYGGSTNPLASEGIQAWHGTIEDDPWLFSGQLTPISALVRDSDIKSGIDTAVAQHLLRRYLGELRRLLHTLVNRRGRDAFLTSLDARLIAMENLPLGQLVPEDVDKLEVDIEMQEAIPVWFGSKTNLCLSYSAYRNDVVCNGTKSDVHCATAGAATPVYHDDNSGGNSGCYMSWSIRSTGFENWFRSVKFCYRWNADGDAYQCHGKASGTVCSATNSYTAKYLDRTDNKYGGCNMSWKIEVPDTAPQWMKAVKLCFSWSSDKDDDQCGSDGSRNMTVCAAANEWTPYYRDNTYQGKGGCLMSWSLTV